MSGGRLSALQWRILEELAGFEPSWTLTGGGALAGVHLQHRVTHDLDLFWHGRDQLGPLTAGVKGRLTSAGLDIQVLQSGATFTQLRVSDGEGVCVVDLVADPVPTLEEPMEVRAGTVTIAVDTPYEIMVNKLCALLSRSEVRDLEDLRVLVETGADLDAALADAPRKDAGFSPLTLAWVLENFPTRALARVAGLGDDDAEKLDRFKEDLIQRLLQTSAPADSPE